MKGSHAILTGPLLLALLAIAFCIWSASGNDVNFCVTTGCTLYQDFTIAKISLWWFGAAAFTSLAACAMLGLATFGRWLAGFFLLGDCCLLLLMAVTAPCVNCLVAAMLFALCYAWFRRQSIMRQQRPGSPVHLPVSILLWCWLALWVVNLGQVVKSQLDVWPILDESGEATTRMFFSPSCKYCVEGIKALSGNVKTAFYPVVEYEADVAKIAKMIALLEDGQSLAEALQQSHDAEFSSYWQSIRPDILLLRFRMLRNKAHLFAQGSQGVPFFEQKGLPAGLVQKRQAAQPERPKPVEMPGQTTYRPGNPEMPMELMDGSQCGGAVPCPPGQSTPHNLQ